MQFLWKKKLMRNTNKTKMLQNGVFSEFLGYADVIILAGEK